MNQTSMTRILKATEGERVPSKTSEESLQGEGDCLAPTGTEVRDFAIITDVRSEAAIKAGRTVSDIAVVEAPVTQGEVRLIEIILAKLGDKYESLSEEDRTYDGRVLTWSEVTRAIRHMPDFLAGLSTLTEPRPYFLNKKGQLVVGDGCAEPPEATRRLNYHKSRSAQTRISYLDEEGHVVVVNGDDAEIPKDAIILSERGLIHLQEEYTRVNKNGRFERANWIWTENDKKPFSARRAIWSDRGVFYRDERPNNEESDLGSRGVLRVNLDMARLTNGVANSVKQLIEVSEVGQIDPGLVQWSADYAPVYEALLDPRLAKLGAEYDALREKDRTYGKVRTWAEVTRAIPNMPDFLEGLSTLTEPVPYFLNEQGQLVIGDGCAEPPEATLGIDYDTSRRNQTRISYLDEKGNVVVVTDDRKEIPRFARVLSEKGLIRFIEEYCRLYNRKFEDRFHIWVESGQYPLKPRFVNRWSCQVPLNAWYEEYRGFTTDGRRRDGVSGVGSRGVLRVNLNFLPQIDI